jgi:hypothetical protein
MAKAESGTLRLGKVEYYPIDTKGKEKFSLPNSP